MVVEAHADMLAPADRVWAEVKRTLERRGVRPSRTDDRELVLEVQESGGLSRTVRVEQPLGPRSRCSERIEVPSGALAPVLWVRAQMAARWRLARLRRTARSL